MASNDDDTDLDMSIEYVLDVISSFSMADKHESSLAYFMSVTHCTREKSIPFLEKTNWAVDQSLDLFFEHERHSNQSIVHSKRIEAPSQQSIIIPTMIQFQRFIESFNVNSRNLLENSTKMINLAMKYTIRNRTTIPSNQIEHWNIHLQVDYTRLKTLLDNDMCAPLLWIEHFEHLLNGDVCQLFDCDYMFDTSEE